MLIFRVAKSMGKTLSDIRVWNNYSLNSLRQDEGLGKTIKDQCQKQGYLYLTAETIFTEKLVVLPGGDRKLKEHSREGEQFCLSNKLFNVNVYGSKSNFNKLHH